jgi:RNA 3'-phosphate cyclase
MIEIDGSIGEAGGQILRTAVALSAVTKKPCHVFNIRKSRPKPGLQTQHLLGIQALAQICKGRLEGDYLGSKEIKFWPGREYREKISVNIPTAGSITLVLQSLIPAALFAPFPIKISFNGGATDTFFSPTIDHFRYVFLKILEKMGAKTEIDILKRGYYPEGGARVEVEIFPAKLKPINLVERGFLKKIIIISGASEFLKNKKVAERQIAGVREILGKLKLPTEEKAEYYDTRCPGSQICLIAEFENTVIGADGLGKLGKPAEQVGKECALQLLEEEKSKACLDRFLTDQILVYLCLVKGKSKVTVSKQTSHFETNCWVIRHFLKGEFKIEDNTVSWIPSE